jgi:hypothetical protein
MNSKILIYIFGFLLTIGIIVYIATKKKNIIEKVQEERSVLLDQQNEIKIQLETEQKEREEEEKRNLEIYHKQKEQEERTQLLKAQIQRDKEEEIRRLEELSLKMYNLQKKADEINKKLEEEKRLKDEEDRRLLELAQLKLEEEKRKEIERLRNEAENKRIIEEENRRILEEKEKQRLARIQSLREEEERIQLLKAQRQREEEEKIRLKEQQRIEQQNLIQKQKVEAYNELLKESEQLATIINNYPFITDTIFENIINIMKNKNRLNEIVKTFNILLYLRENGIPQYNNYEVDYEFNYILISKIIGKKCFGISCTLNKPYYFKDNTNFNRILYENSIDIDSFYSLDSVWKILENSKKYLITNGQLGDFSIFCNWFLDKNNETPEFAEYTKDSRDINRFLLYPDKFIAQNSPEIVTKSIQTVKLINNAFLKVNPLPVDIIVYRGVGYDMYDILESSRINEFLEFPLFTSTSWSKEKAKYFTGRLNNLVLKRFEDSNQYWIPNLNDCVECCLMKIYVPKGSLFFIPPQWRTEHEIIFNRYAKFKLIKIEDEVTGGKGSITDIDKDKYKVDCENNTLKLRTYILEFIGYNEQALAEFDRKYISNETFIYL